MYLKKLEAAEPHPDAGRFGQVIARCRKHGVEVPGIYHLFNARPEAARHLCNYMEEVMRGPSPLSPGWRELIAAFTSARNDCLF